MKLLFACYTRKELIPNAPEFQPTTHYFQPENSVFLFDLSKRDFETDDESCSSYEDSQTSTNRELQCSDSNSDFDSCFEDESGCITKLGHSESEDETCYEESHSNLSETTIESENDESCVLEPGSLCRVSEVIFYGSKVSSDILNIVVAPQKSTK